MSRGYWRQLHVYQQFISVFDTKKEFYKQFHHDRESLVLLGDVSDLFNFKNVDQQAVYDYYWIGMPILREQHGPLWFVEVLGPSCMIVYNPDCLGGSNVGLSRDDYQ